MYVVKSHKGTDGQLVVAACDKNLVGQTFEDDSMQLYLSESYYMGEEIDDRVVEWLQQATTFTIAGPHIIDLALQNDLISKNGVRYVDGVPFAMGVFLS